MLTLRAAWTRAVRTWDLMSSSKAPYSAGSISSARFIVAIFSHPTDRG